MRFLTILAALLLTPAAAFAQYYSGGSNWDFSIGAIYQTGKSAGGSNGSSLQTSDEVGLGLTLGYKLNRWFTIGGDFDYLSPRYSAVLVSENDPTDTIDINHRATQFNGRIKGTLNFMEGPFVPYAQLGIGWSSFDSNVADGPPQTGCWWHPWWGYICSNYYRTYGSSEFSYGVAVGARYEFAGGTFLNLSYDYWELDTGGSRANPGLESIRLLYGWKF
jgi:opacity protein-like surface antigen